MPGCKLCCGGGQHSARLSDLPPSLNPRPAAYSQRRAIAPGGQPLPRVSSPPCPKLRAGLPLHAGDAAQRPATGAIDSKPLFELVVSDRAEGFESCARGRVHPATKRFIRACSTPLLSARHGSRDGSRPHLLRRSCCLADGCTCSWSATRRNASDLVEFSWPR